MLVEAVLQMFFACVSVQLRKQLSHLIKLWQKACCGFVQEDMWCNNLERLKIFVNFQVVSILSNEANGVLRLAYVAFSRTRLVDVVTW